MSKSLKQEQDELFAGLENILPTAIELSYETRGKKTSSKILSRTEEEKAVMHKKYSELQKGRPSPLKGLPLSEEHRQKLSEAHKGKPSLHKGKTKSEETRKRMAQGRKGIVFTEEHRKNIGLAKKGQIVSEETREKLREANLRNGNRPPVSNPKGSKRDPSFSKKMKRPVKTRVGIFPSVGDAVIGYKQAGIPNAGKRLRLDLKEGKEDCCFISKEEYTRLTGIILD